MSSSAIVVLPLPSPPPIRDVESRRAGTSQRGFVSHELTIAMAILALAVGIGVVLSSILELQGPAVVVPAAILVGLFAAWVIGLNVAEAARQRRRARDGGAEARPSPGPTGPQPPVSPKPTTGGRPDRGGETLGPRCADETDARRSNTAMRRLLMVEGAFPIAGRGIVVSPALPRACDTAARETRAELRRPDGSALQVELQIVIEHLNGQLDTPEAPEERHRLVCLLRGVAIDEVQPGCEIWCSDELASGDRAC